MYLQRPLAGAHTRRCGALFENRLIDVTDARGVKLLAPPPQPPLAVPWKCRAPSSPLSSQSCNHATDDHELGCGGRLYLHREPPSSGQIHLAITNFTSTYHHDAARCHLSVGGGGPARVPEAATAATAM